MMEKKIPIAHQKVIEKYNRLYADIRTDEFKVCIRKIIEQIINYLYLKYQNIDINNNEISGVKNPSVTTRIKTLVEDKRILKIHQPLFYFLYKEGNLGAHTSNNPMSAGEDSILEGLIICIKPIIKFFFDNEGLNSEFLDKNNLSEVSYQKNRLDNKKLDNLRLEELLKNATLLIENKSQEYENLRINFEQLQSEKVNLEELLTRAKIEIKHKVYMFGFTFLILIIPFYYFLNSYESDLNSKSNELIECKKENNVKDNKIDSLKLIIDNSQQKSNNNNGIQNDFKGSVENVINTEKIDKLGL